jgi:transcriptional regulator with XRE-family HTH domain
MLRPKFETFKVLKTIKLLIKQKKLSYADLATGLGVSLPTIKRWLNSDDISIATLLSISEFLEVDLLDLLEHARDRRTDECRFTAEQENFFARHLSYLAYYYELRRGLDPSAIERKHGIKASSTLRYLTKLEQLGLIRLSSRKRVAIAMNGPIVWDDRGPLGQVASKQMLKELSDRAAASLQLKAGSAHPPHLQKLELQLWGQSLTDGDLAEMRGDYLALEEKYRARGQFNTKFRARSELKYVSGCVIFDQWDASVFTRVTDL